MKFIITIRDTNGHFLAEHEDQAEPEYIPQYDSYMFYYKKPFYLMIDREAFNSLERKEESEINQ